MNSGPPPAPSGAPSAEYNNHYNGQYSSSSYHSTPNGRYEDDSHGFDSGQGSSLDREYNDRYASNNSSKGQYYYNLPQHQKPVESPRKSGDGLDLTNREYRGSAFELYKKPVQLQQQQSYHSLQQQQL